MNNRLQPAESGSSRERKKNEATISWLYFTTPRNCTFNWPYTDDQIYVIRRIHVGMKTTISSVVESRWPWLLQPRHQRGICPVKFLYLRLHSVVLCLSVLPSGSFSSVLKLHRMWKELKSVLEITSTSNQDSPFHLMKGTLSFGTLMHHYHFASPLTGGDSVA